MVKNQKNQIKLFFSIIRPEDPKFKRNFCFVRAKIWCLTVRLEQLVLLVFGQSAHLDALQAHAHSQALGEATRLAILSLLHGHVTLTMHGTRVATLPQYAPLVEALAALARRYAVVDTGSFVIADLAHAELIFVQLARGHFSARQKRRQRRRRRRFCHQAELTHALIHYLRVGGELRMHFFFAELRVSLI